MTTTAPAPRTVRGSQVRDDTWLWALVGLALGLFGVGFVVRWQCTAGACALTGHEWVLDPDAIGGLPRLFTTALFAVTTAVAVRAGARSARGPRLWWAAIAATGAALVLAKLASVHSVLEAWDGAGPALLLGSIASLVGLPVLGVLGRAWGVPGSGAVVLALAGYAAAALGLDVVTGLVAAARPDPLSTAAATVVEELGEALAAIALLAVVVRGCPLAARGAVPRTPVRSRW